MSKQTGIEQDCLQSYQLESKMLKEGHHVTIKELHARGTAKRAIARLLGIDIKTVRRHIKKANWGAYQRDAGNYTQLLESERIWLLNRMSEVGYNATILFRELKLKGYEGSYETVKLFVRPHRERSYKACIRYETAPGEQIQVDWGSAWVWLNDKQIKVHFFALVLGYSRRLYAKGYLNERFVSLIEGHEEAFRWFGGITNEILYDNAKTMITVHNVQTGELKLNQQFEDFARYYGFKPRFCKPYRPQTKGKIESGVKYLKRNFLPGRRFKDLNHLNAELEKWILETADTRIHGTTHQRPIDRFSEEKLMSISRPQPYQYIPAIQRKVSQDSRVSFLSNHYSVPWIYVGKCVDLKVTQGQLLISADGTTIAIHNLLQGKHQQSVSKQHYAGLLHYRNKRQAEIRPRYDPYWRKDEAVEIRDLKIYETAAYASSVSSMIH